MRGTLFAAPLMLFAAAAAAQDAPPETRTGSFVSRPAIALPELPAAPVMTDTPYPECRYRYRERSLMNYRAEDAAGCIAEIDAYYEAVLQPFRAAMQDHQQTIAAIYEERVLGNPAFSQDQIDAFFVGLTREHEASQIDGEYLAEYRAAEGRYRDDREFLAERFCRYTECAEFDASDVTARRDAEDGMLGCGVQRGGGMFVGGLVGTMIGELREFGERGAQLTSMMADIACRLRPEEQQRAAEATQQVLEREEVGATAAWVSPSRPEVSGSSTVTALTSQPDGARCLDITDVVIIEGEEMRVEKTMCRAAGETRYRLRA
ncbi:MAG: hypothetical protein ABR601_03100 [Parasphingopyxis sp.]|nr:hypothetical protein [Sphingomonadales bacterium]